MSEHVLDALRDAINSHDPARVAACFTADYVNERPLRPHEGFVGDARVRENWTRLLTGLPDLRAEILRSARDGEEIWSEWEMRGTDPAGAVTLLRGPVVLTTRDGRIAWSRFYLDPVSHGDRATSTTVSAVVAVPADRIFALLTDPARHRDVDASGTIRHAESGGVHTESRVVVLEPGRAVGRAPAEPGDRPLGERVVWRLTPLDDDRTEVTRTDDWSAVTHPQALVHLPVRTAEELTGSIRLLEEVLGRPVSAPTTACPAAAPRRAGRPPT